MTRPTEDRPGAVSGRRHSRRRTRPDGEVRTRWAWTEPEVWTDRMLTALEHGVQGGKWFRLIDKVYASGNLRAAFKRVAANKGAAGVDHVTIKAFARHLEDNLSRLERALRERSYRPQVVRRVWIPKPGRKVKRPLGIPTVRDRVVQTALRQALEPIFERDFAEHSYGFRPGRGCKDALRRVAKLVRMGYRYAVDADLESYFDTIPHDRLVSRIREKVSDGRVISLIEMFLKQGVLDGLREWTPTHGSPQGAVISPLLSNVYLDPLDREMAERGFQMVRYADDFVVLCRTRAEAEAALELVRAWTATAGLMLHPEKTGIVDVETDGVDFLGYHFQGKTRWPRKQSIKKLKEAIRAKTRRNNGHSLNYIIADVNRTLRGWFEYFKHSHFTSFKNLDGWTRMRLRTILRCRENRYGRSRPGDLRRWPNAFFTEHGLFTLVAAHRLVCQSSLR
jgi:RNA-directed DNA polymerase